MAYLNQEITEFLARNQPQLTKKANLQFSGAKMMQNPTKPPRPAFTKESHHSSSNPPQTFAKPLKPFQSSNKQGYLTEEAFKPSSAPKIEAPHSAAAFETTGYSRKARSTQYTPYSLREYQISKPHEYMQLGSLGSHLIGTEEWTKKQQDLVRRKEYGKLVTRANTKTKPVPKPEPAPKEPSAREKALEFAKHVPKPALRTNKVTKTESPQHEPPKPLLSQLEEKHRLYQAAIDEIRSNFNK